MDDVRYISMEPMDAAVVLGAYRYLYCTNDEVREYILKALSHRDPADPKRVVLKHYKSPSYRYYITAPLDDNEHPTEIKSVVLKRETETGFKRVIEPDQGKVLKRTYNGVTEIIFDPRKDDPYATEPDQRYSPNSH